MLGHYYNKQPFKYTKAPTYIIFVLTKKIYYLLKKVVVKTHEKCCTLKSSVSH